MYERLKKCPFCGSPALLRQENNKICRTICKENIPYDGRIVDTSITPTGKTSYHYMTYLFTPYCSNKDCLMHGFRTRYRSSKLAVNAWNKREEDYDC